jgi:hypothetical protein
VDSPGERSSQYAAESSCRLRFGDHVDWIGQFDIDEYLIPMGDHKTATSLLAKLDEEDTKIISFPSWRAWPRWEFINPIEKILDAKVCWSNEPCFHLSIPQNKTMLQAYNCDRQLPGKKSQVMPAEKQIYKAGRYSRSALDLYLAGMYTHAILISLRLCDAALRPLFRGDSSICVE